MHTSKAFRLQQGGGCSMLVRGSFRFFPRSFSAASRAAEPLFVALCTPTADRSSHFSQSFSSTHELDMSFTQTSERWTQASAVGRQKQNRRVRCTDIWMFFFSVFCSFWGILWMKWRADPGTAWFILKTCHWLLILTGVWVSEQTTAHLSSRFISPQRVIELLDIIHTFLSILLHLILLCMNKMKGLASVERTYIALQLSWEQLKMRNDSCFFKPWKQHYAHSHVILSWMTLSYYVVKF